MYKTFHLWLSLHFFVRFVEKNPPLKYYGAFVNFSRTYEVAKFWMIKLYRDVSDVIDANEDTKYANCDLPVNISNFFLISFFFMMKKNLI